VVRGEKPNDPERIVKGVRAHVLIPIDPRTDAEKVCGWAALTDPTDLDLTAEKMFFGPTVALALRVDTLVPPPSVVKRLVAERLKATGRRVNRAEKMAAKEEVKKSLRHKTLPTTRAVDVVWQSDRDTVHVWSHAKNTNEMVIDLFFKSFGLELVPRGPTIVGGRGAIPPGLAATPEMVLGFPGMPGRPLPEDGQDDETLDEDDLVSEMTHA
jgi:DNA recombination-dependent growth factor C